MIETRESILPSEVTPISPHYSPEVTKIQEAHSEDRTTTETEVIIDNKGLEVILDRTPQIEV